MQLEKPKAYGSWSAYSRSKQANILFVVELRRRFAAENVGIGAFALHPGVINTGLIAGHLWGPLDRFTRNVVMPTFKALLTRLLATAAATTVLVSPFSPSLITRFGSIVLI